MKIFLNPGHTPQWQVETGIDFDVGAVGNGMQENVVCAEVCKLIEQESKNYGIEVVKNFQSMSLQEITSVANSTNAEVFVSVHCNASTPAAKGTEVFYCQGSSAGKKIADFVQKNIIVDLKTVDRGIKDDTQTQYNRIHVLRKSAMPAILIELCFISNSDDAKLLKNNKLDFAKAILKGLAEYFGMKVPAPDVIDKPADKKIGEYEKVAEKLKSAGFDLDKHTDAIKLVAILSGADNCVNLFNLACKNLGYPNLSYIDDRWFDDMIIYESLKILQRI